MRVFAFVLTFSIAGALTSSAQSLADVARKEGERRRAVPETGRVYTNQDLKQVPQPPVDAAAAPATPDDKPDPAATDEKAGSGADVPAKTADQQTPAKDQAYWSKRMAAVRDQLERDETFLAALQTRVDALTADFVNRDDPAQRGQIAADRQKAVTELDRLKKAVEQDRRAIPEVEEEARKAGVPAGWLR
jgi:hypothetical protein